jgi:hypothetical protein
MEISKGNSLCSYLYLKYAKISCFSFHLFSFFFYKFRENRAEQVLPREGGIVQVGEDRWVGGKAER